MDIADEAGIVIEGSTAASIQRIAEALEQPGKEHCIDCGIRIPTARRKASPNAQRCIDCQHEYEEKPHG